MNGIDERLTRAGDELRHAAKRSPAVEVPSLHRLRGAMVFALSLVGVLLLMGLPTLLLGGDVPSGSLVTRPSTVVTDDPTTVTDSTTGTDAPTAVQWPCGLTDDEVARAGVVLENQTSIGGEFGAANVIVLDTSAVNEFQIPAIDLYKRLYTWCSSADGVTVKRDTAQRGLGWVGQGPGANNWTYGMYTGRSDETRMAIVTMTITCDTPCSEEEILTELNEIGESAVTG